MSGSGFRPLTPHLLTTHQKAMAASDQHYRDQYGLDIVFALSCLAMLGAVLIMFIQDYNGPWKPEQRVFRDVESELAMRTALHQLPSLEEVNEAEQEVAEARKDRESRQAKIDETRAKIRSVLPKKETAEGAYQGVKSLQESRLSFYNIAVENNNAELAKIYSQEVTR